MNVACRTILSSAARQKSCGASGATSRGSFAASLPNALVSPSASPCMAKLLASGASCLLLGAGCGMGGPLLHGPHVLAPGVVRVAGGVSSQFATGAGRIAIENARALADNPAGDSASQVRDTQARAAAAVLAFGPGTSAVLSARVGLPGDNEGGITYTGQLVRGDARHMFEFGAVALSLGAGLSADTYVGRDPRYPVEVKRQFSVPGIDVPVLLGWQDKNHVLTL